MKLEPQHRRYLPYAIVAATVLILVLLWLLSPGRDTAPLQEQRWQVAAVKAKRGDYSPQLILYGTTESPRKTVLRAALEADVKEIFVHEGDIVEKEKVLLKLDDRDIKLRVIQRKAEVNILKAKIKAENIRHAADKASFKHEERLVKLNRLEVSRHVELQKSDLVADTTVDKTRRELHQQQLALRKRQLDIEDHSNRLGQLNAQLNSAKALQRQEELDLSRTEIRAPFKARISALKVSIGDRVRDGDELINLFDIGEVEVRAQIPSFAVTQIQQALASGKPLIGKAILDGQTVELICSHLAGEVRAGRGGVDGIFQIKSTSAHLALGRSLKVTLTLPVIKNVFALPQSALYQTRWIYIVKEERMKSIRVQRRGTLYAESNQKNSVLLESKELKNNDWVITTQLPNARDGLRVTVVK